MNLIERFSDIQLQFSSGSQYNFPSNAAFHNLGSADPWRSVSIRPLKTPEGLWNTPRDIPRCPRNHLNVKNPVFYIQGRPLLILGCYISAVKINSNALQYPFVHNLTLMSEIIKSIDYSILLKMRSNDFDNMQQFILFLLNTLSDICFSNSNTLKIIPITCAPISYGL